MEIRNFGSQNDCKWNQEWKKMEERKGNPCPKNKFTFPRPAPMIALVGVSISGIPGPPLGPSPLITTTFPWKLRT